MSNDYFDSSIYGNMLLSSDVKERRALAKNTDYTPTNDELEVGLIDDDWLVRWLWNLRKFHVRRRNRKVLQIRQSDPRLLARQVLAGQDAERQINFILFGDYYFNDAEVDLLLDHKNHQIRKAIATRDNISLQKRHIKKIMNDKHWEVRIAIPMRKDIEYDFQMIYQGLNDPSPWVRGCWHGIKKGRGLVK